MVRRIVVLLSVIALGAAAPARAWCEASCLAPQQDSPHCPSHEPTGDAATISASGTADCPVLESARPAVPARAGTSAIVVASHSPSLKTSAIHLPTPIRPHSATTVFERCTPLRI